MTNLVWASLFFLLPASSGNRNSQAVYEWDVICPFSQSLLVQQLCTPCPTDGPIMWPAETGYSDDGDPGQWIWGTLPPRFRKSGSAVSGFIYKQSMNKITLSVLFL